MHVIKPGEGFPRESFRRADFDAYYRLVRRRLEETLAAPASGSTYPDPVPHCDELDDEELLEERKAVTGLTFVESVEGTGGTARCPNRLNVAISRARCACIVVASPRLFEPDCRTPEQMRWANGLCRFRELAREIDPWR
jgi:hypothetical protein